MKRILRSGFLLIAACTASTLGLRAQTVIYSTDFADDQGWTFTSNWPSVVWAVDATPATVLGSPAWRSPPYSLNYNNGVDYGGTNTHNEGTATSPPIDLSAATGALTLGFWCNYATETGLCAGYDSRTLYIENSLNQQVFYTCFGWFYCGSTMGQWHYHSYPLNAQWGTIRLKFHFDTVDNSDNGHPGWFLDDLQVTEECPATITYCTPKLNSQGCSPTIFTTGTPSFSGSAQAFRIWGANVLNQKVGLMLWGRAPAATPFGGGTLCIAPPVARTAAQNSGGTALPSVDCTGTYVLQFTPAMMNQAGLVLGDDVYSQYWSRDNGFAAPDNVGLTAGVHWAICP